MAKQQKNGQVEALERGEIFFLYRPAVEEEEVQGLADVQRFYMLLHPEGARNHRLIVVGKKKLPEADTTGERYWGFVDEVLRTDKQLKEALGPEHYETKTRGERTVPSMRPAGTGEYEISRHGDHTHLSYKLAVPGEPAQVQKDLNIASEASYIISIKNPDASTPQGAGLEGGQKADLPKHLQEQFKGRRFVDADPPQFLDHEGVELLLISTDENLKELGMNLEASDEEIEKDAAQVFKALRMQESGEQESEEKEKPLHSGQWR